MRRIKEYKYFKEDLSWEEKMVKYDNLVKDFESNANNYMSFIIDRMIPENDLTDFKNITFSLIVRNDEPLDYEEIRYDFSSFIEYMLDKYEILSIEFISNSYNTYSATLDEILNDTYDGPKSINGIEITIPFL